MRRGEHGWRVGNDETADLTSAMVLADLLAADLGTPAPPPAGPPRHSVANHGAVSELARKQPPARKRGPSPRHARSSASSAR